MAAIMQTAPIVTHIQFNQFQCLSHIIKTFAVTVRRAQFTLIVAQSKVATLRSCNSIKCQFVLNVSESRATKFADQPVAEEEEAIALSDVCNRPLAVFHPEPMFHCNQVATIKRQ